MEKISTKAYFVIGLTLFSMFFGAGNFIFPPLLGYQAGSHTLTAIIAFCLTGVLFPILGIAAVAKSNGLYNLSSRVSHSFAIIYSVILLLIIGPLFAIPRAGSLPFDLAIKPFLSSSQDNMLLIYSIVYFVINFFLCINPTKMIDILGKILTPLLLIMIVILFLAVIIHPMHSGAISDLQASGDYVATPFIKGFFEGYQTMDALAALNFGIAILITYRNLGITNERVVVSSTIKAGIIAGVVLAIVYFMLAYLGASSAGAFKLGENDNGATILVHATNFLFGKYGNAILGISVGLACLTTTVGLICSISEFFENLTKIKYHFWVILLCIVSAILANLGLSQIIKYGIPLLFIIYPISLCFIVLSLLDGIVKSSKIVYSLVIYPTLLLSLVHTLESSYNIKIPVLADLFKRLPFYDIQLEWVIPALVFFFVGLVVKKR